MSACAPVLFVLAGLIISTFGCGLQNDPPCPPTSVEPAPKISSLAPNTAAAGTAGVALDIRGQFPSQFLSVGVSDSSGQSSAKLDFFEVSNAEITATLPSSWLRTAGTLKIFVDCACVSNGVTTPYGVDSATFTVTGSSVTSVSVAPQGPTVPARTSAAFTATALPAGSNQNVTWTLLQNGVACGTSCGTLDNSSFNPVTYTAPAVVPTPNTVTLRATSVADSTKFGETTITVGPSTVSISFSVAPPASIPVQTTAGVAAVVANDSTTGQGGVDWTLTTTAPGGCAPAGSVDCGGFNPSHTGSGGGTIYTAPGTIPPGGATLTITATSTFDPTKSVSAVISILPGAVSIHFSTAPPATVQTFSSVALTAVVNNDSTNIANRGVDWTVTTTASGGCGPAGLIDCGGFQPTHTDSQISTNYVAPLTIPPGGTLTITATSTFDKTKSVSAVIIVIAGNLSLNGDYALDFIGYDANPTAYPPQVLNTGAIGFAGRFHADGHGNLSNVSMDFNLTDRVAAISGVTGTYTLGADNRGSMTIQTGGSQGLAPALVLNFVLNSTGNGRLIEFDDSIGGGGGHIGSGEFRKQTPSAFSLSSFNGSFSFGVAGELPGNLYDRQAMVGRYTSSTGGLISAAQEEDTIQPGEKVFAGQINTPDVNTGRGTMQWNISNIIVNFPLTLNWAVYIIDANSAFVIDTDARNRGSTTSVGQPFFTGEVRGQHFGTATDSTLVSGPSVLYSTAISVTGVYPNNTIVPAVGVAEIQFVSNPGFASGTVSVSEDQNVSGPIGLLTTGAAGLPNSTYRVWTGSSEIGRVSVSYFLPSTQAAFDTYGLLIYLTGPNEGFLLGGLLPSLSLDSFGFMEAQVGGPFAGVSVAGNYVGATVQPSLLSVTNGDFSLTLANGNPGTVSGKGDSSAVSGLTQNSTFSGAYSTTSSGIGRFDFPLTSPSTQDFTGYFITPTKCVLIPVTPTNTTPALIILDQ